MKTRTQEFHDAIIDLLNKCDEYGNLKPYKETKSLLRNEADFWDVRKAVELILGVINCRSGSLGSTAGNGYSIYRLLDAYLLEVDKRKEINKIIGLS